MLAVGRALILNPALMLLDEPLEGLAPILVEELLAALHRIIRDEGMSAILVEQNARRCSASPTGPRCSSAAAWSTRAPARNSWPTARCSKATSASPPFRPPPRRAQEEQ